jgi:hypothetical protein
MHTNGSVGGSNHGELNFYCNLHVLNIFYMKDISSLKKKLAGYSAMAATVIACSNNSDGQVVYTDVNPDDTLIGTSQYLLDLNNDGIVDFRIRRTELEVICHTARSVSVDGYGLNEVLALYPDNDHSAYPLKQNFLISENNILYLGTTSIYQLYWETNALLWRTSIWPCTTNTSGNTTYWTGQAHWPLASMSEKRFLGLRLSVDNSIYYGWVRLSIDLNNTMVIVKDYAYDSIPNEPILTGNSIPTGITSVPAPDLFNAFVKNEQLFIHFYQSPLTSQIILLNDLGVKLNAPVVTKTDMVMDVSQIAKGIYFVVVDDNRTRCVKKVVIE